MGPTPEPSLEQRVASLESAAKDKTASHKEEGTGLKLEAVALSAMIGAISGDFKLIKADFALFDVSDYLRKLSVNHWRERKRQLQTSEGLEALGRRDYEKALKAREDAENSRRKAGEHQNPTRHLRNASQADAEAIALLERANRRLEAAANMAEKSIEEVIEDIVRLKEELRET
ncbi:hypothetical protein [Actinomadura chokoriensis]|uniref:hypothetical protein n=1 Tax=Actinomadura chokoriensis TaxID=454156 RepID=UPI0031F74DAD